MDISAPHTPTDPRSFKSFAEFYPFYLTEHSNPSAGACTL